MEGPKPLKIVQVDQHVRCIGQLLENSTAMYPSTLDRSPD